MADAEIQARVIRAVGGLYTLLDEAGETYIAKPRGIFRKTQFQVLPGDSVTLGPSGDVDIPWRIDIVDKRKNLLLRPPMANLDFLFIVLARSKPEPDFIFLDKMLAYAASLGIDTCIVITKTDLQQDAETDRYIKTQIQAYREAEFTVLESSQDDLGKSVGRFAETQLRNKIWALAGPSGVGKSSLVNALMDEKHMDTGAISVRMGRGKHTTRHVELIPYKGGFMVDTPGFSALEVGTLVLSGTDLDAAFPDFAVRRGQCRFADCKHRHEPGCALKEAVNEKPLQEGRFARYAILLEQIETAEALRKEGKK